LTLALAALASVLYLVTLHDTLAPLVLGLPEHHCPYCLFQEFPDTALFAGLFWVGIAAAGWRAGVELVWEKIQHSNENLQGLSRTLLKMSSAALLFSLVSLVSHILVAI